MFCLVCFGLPLERSHVWHKRCTSTTFIDRDGAPTSPSVICVSGLNKLGSEGLRAPLAVVHGCRSSRPYGHAGVPQCPQQHTGVTRWSSVTKDQFKIFGFQVRLLRVHLANFTPLSEFQFEARVGFDFGAALPPFWHQIW